MTRLILCFLSVLCRAHDLQIALALAEIRRDAVSTAFQLGDRVVDTSLPHESPSAGSCAPAGRLDRGRAPPRTARSPRGRVPARGARFPDSSTPASAADRGGAIPDSVRSPRPRRPRRASATPRFEWASAWAGSRRSASCSCAMASSTRPCSEQRAAEVVPGLSAARHGLARSGDRARNGRPCRAPATRPSHATGSDEGRPLQAMGPADRSPPPRSASRPRRAPTPSDSRTDGSRTFQMNPS